MMNEITKLYLKDFEFSTDEQGIMFKQYPNFSFLLDVICSGNGPIGNNYLQIWPKSKIEKLNTLYKTSIFMTDIILFGSDGSETAYGVNIKKQFISVPFIGMADENVSILANDFDGFIEYLATAD